MEHKLNLTPLKRQENIVLENYDVFVIFQFMVDLEQSEIQIPNTWSIFLTFSLKKNLLSCKI